MNNKIKEILFDIVTIILLIFFLLTVFDVIEIKYFIDISNIIIWIFSILATFYAIRVIYLSAKFPKNKFSNKEVQVFENCFTAFLTLSILYTFFWSLSVNKILFLYMFTFIFLLAYLFAKINQKRKNINNRYNLREWAANLIWVFTPAIFVSSFVGSLIEPLNEKVVYLLIFLIILTISMQKLKKFKKD